MNLINDIFSKEGLLIIVQVDHLSGEILGSVFDSLYEAGAYNVQCCPTIIKKNRPGHIFFIDLNPKDKSKIENVIINSLASSGWHLIETKHNHIAHKNVTKNILVEVEDFKFEFTLQSKVTSSDFDIIRPEIDNCKALQETIKEKCKLDIPLKNIYLLCQNAWINNLDKINFNNTFKIF